jgi:hypothetical protein
MSPSNTTVQKANSISILNHTASMTGGGTLQYSASGLTGSGLDVNSTTGAITATAGMATAGTYSVILTAQDDSMYCTSINYATCKASFMSFDITVSGGGGATITFSTASSLGTVGAGDNINETIDASASNFASITYSFVSTNDGPGASQGITGSTVTGTNITIGSNYISGIAPRLYVAATYSFGVTATATGATSNNRTFTLDITRDVTCVSPTSNICT